MSTHIPVDMTLPTLKLGFSEDSAWAARNLESLSWQIDLKSIPWQSVRQYGLINQLMPLKKGQGSSGRILAHCKQMVTSFRENMGIRLTVFKIEVTADPLSRFRLYLAKNYTRMWIIYSSMDVREIHMLEAALIALFENAVGLQNTPQKRWRRCSESTERGRSLLHICCWGARRPKQKGRVNGE